MTTAVAAVITGMCAACQCSFQSWVVIQTAPVRHRRQTQPKINVHSANIKPEGGIQCLSVNVDAFATACLTLTFHRQNLIKSSAGLVNIPG